MIYLSGMDSETWVAFFFSFFGITRQTNVFYYFAVGSSLIFGQIKDSDYNLQDRSSPWSWFVRQAFLQLSFRVGGGAPWNHLTQKRAMIRKEKTKKVNVNW
jgi:hypothetical protein